MGLWLLITWLLLGMTVVGFAWPLIYLAIHIDPELRDMPPGFIAVAIVVLVLVWPLVLKELSDNHWL